LVNTKTVSRWAIIPMTTTPPGSSWKSSAAKAKASGGAVENAMRFPQATSSRPAAAQTCRSRVAPSGAGSPAGIAQATRSWVGPAHDWPLGR
jgi:hypothetical protein